MSSCCGACGGQDSEPKKDKAKDQDQPKEQEQKQGKK